MQQDLKIKTLNELGLPLGNPLLTEPLNDLFDSLFDSMYEDQTDNLQSVRMFGPLEVHNILQATIAFLRPLREDNGDNKIFNSLLKISEVIHITNQKLNAADADKLVLMVPNLYKDLSDRTSIDTYNAFVVSMIEKNYDTVAFFNIVRDYIYNSFAYTYSFPETPSSEILKMIEIKFLQAFSPQYAEPLYAIIFSDDYPKGIYF